jgi:glutamine synthetase
MEYVLRTVEERGVRLIRLWFTDVLGQLKSFAISPAELESAFEEGMHFDGSAIDGFSRIQESDVLARPDAATFELLPWDDRRSVGPHVLRHHDPGRHTLRRRPASGSAPQPHAARDQGYSFFVAPEIEFFYFATAIPPRSPNRSTPVPTST